MSASIMQPTESYPYHYNLFGQWHSLK